MRWVSRYFDQPGFVRALTNVSLEVHRGEVFGLLGPAGSGKSTLIRILAGRLTPSEGKASVFNRSPNRRATRARVGYLPQHSADVGSSVFSEVVDFLKEVFWLKKIGGRKGMRATATAQKSRHDLLRQILIKNPELILLDDPFFELDPAGCDEVFEIIRVLKQRGRTVMISGSSLLQAKDICDRLAILRRGHVETVGTLQDFLMTPKGLSYVSDLLPQATQERVLNLIRHDLGLPEKLSQARTEVNVNDERSICQDCTNRG